MPYAGRQEISDQTAHLQNLNGGFIARLQNQWLLYIKYNNIPLLRPLITKVCLFKYIEKFTTIKIENFQIKIPDIFHISAQNIDCGYSLEPPRRGGSNEYPQSMF